MTITEGMSTNDSAGQIHAEMAAILDELPAVGKDSTNKGLGFSFRGHEALVNALNPLMGKHGVVPRLYETHLQQWVPLSRGFAAVVKNTYRLTARDGSWVQAEGLGEGHDFADKAVSKANTMAYKVMLGQTFNVAFQDEADPDGDSVETSSGTGATQGESRSEEAEARTGPPPPPAEETPLQKLNRENYDRVKKLPADEFNALKKEMAEKGMPMDFSDHTQEQANWIVDKTSLF